MKRRSAFGKALAASAFMLAVSSGAAHAQGSLTQGYPALWQGFYLGVHVGGGWGRVTSPEIDVTVDPTGALAGVYLGYNWQFGSTVFGIEADGSVANLKWSMTNGVASAAARTHGMGTLRARLGMTTGPALLYLTGGYAVASLKLDQSDGVTSDYMMRKADGWVLGGGLEYAFSPALVARIEGLHHNMTASFDDMNARYKVNVVRAGLAYKF